MYLAHVVVAIPTCNSEKYLGTVLLKARGKFSHILVVDNASEDDTVKIAKAAGADIVRHPMEFGTGAVYRTLLRAAIDKSPEVLVVLNGNGYCNPDEISHVLDPVLSGDAEIVECSETGFAAYSGSVLRSLMVRENRIQVDESRLEREPAIKILQKSSQTVTHKESMTKSEFGGVVHTE
jgi:glycosyltransferase involved in cell wall biosynthesis